MNFNEFFVINLAIINVVSAGIFLWWIIATDNEKRRKILMIGAINVPALLVLSYFMARAVGAW